MPYIIQTVSYDEENDSYEDISFVTDCYGVKSTVEGDSNARVYYVENLPNEDDVDTAELTPLTSEQIALLPEDADDGELVTDDAFDVNEINANVINTQKLISITAQIMNADIESATIETLQAELANIVSLRAQNANLNNLIAVTAKLVNATIENADINALSAEIAKVKSVSALMAEVVTLETQKANVAQLNAAEARIVTLEIDSLTADSAIITDLQTNSLKVDFANIDYEKVNVSNIAQLFANVGLIDRATIVDGHITGFLDAVNVNANNITAGTLIAARIALVQTDEDGNQTGLIYALNNLGELTSNSVDTIDGAVITKRTITADHVVTKSLTSNEIDVEDLFAQTVTATNLTISGNSKLNGVTATNLTVTGNSTFSGTLNGATGKFSGSVEAESISVFTTLESGYRAGLGVTKSQDPEAPAGYFEVTLGVLKGNAWQNYLQLNNDGAGFSGNLNVGGDLTAKTINGCVISDINTLGGEFVHGGTINSIDFGPWLRTHPSFVGTAYNGTAWYNFISCRHRNGADDGSQYGMWLYAPLTSNGDLIWQQEYGNTWQPTKTIIDSSNIGKYANLYSLPASAPGKRGGAELLAGTFAMGSVAAGSYLDKTYTFSSGTFSGVPNVVICKYETGAGTSASGNAARSITLMAKAANSIKVRAYNNSSSSWSPYISFFAIYRGS
ncbi:MAG: hypothetical protein Q4F79_05685 [Eubacteriales bacterium]|nr:hypothetical protein [Eubacteriales bacterium]